MDPVVAHALRHHREAKRIVEVGVGQRPETARTLAIAIPGCRVVATDVDVRALARLSGEPFLAVRDDVSEPDMRRYLGASLVYAVRPPPELVPYIQEVAAAAGAECLCVHLTEETGLYQAYGWEPVVDGAKVVAWRKPAPAAVVPPAQ
jgi:uncharacterized protein